MRDHCAHPLLLLVDVHPREEGLPCKAFVGVEESGAQQLLISATGADEGEGATSTRDIGHNRTFAHVPCQVGAYEAEENAVEHLLRDVRDNTYSNLAKSTHQRFRSLDSLKLRLHEIRDYVDHVLSGELPMNQEIFAQLQDALNALPAASAPASRAATGAEAAGMPPASAMEVDDAAAGAVVAGVPADALSAALSTKTNDMMLSVYMANLVRGVIALHNLLNNKLTNRERENGGKLKREEPKKPKAASE